jgi:histidyl-tRNA synthetase
VESLRNYFTPQIDKMCEDCKNRLKTNPLRILDCKDEDCHAIINGAPKISESLCDACNSNFGELLSLLDAIGIKYELNDKLVRGLDYYTNLVFEFWDDDGINKAALGGGGRYDNLVEQLGGKSTPVVGFGIGIERLIMYIESKGREFEPDDRLDVYVVSMVSDNGVILKVAKTLRDNGISCETDVVNRGVKAQFKYANKINAKFVITIGDDEINENKVSIKNMDTSEQIKIWSNDVAEYLNKCLHD